MAQLATAPARRPHQPRRLPDSRRRLRRSSAAFRKAHDPLGGTAQGSGDAQHRWNGCGGRLYEVTGATTTRFLYDGDELVGEYATAGAMLKRYVHGIAVDDPVIQYDGSGIASTALRHLLADRQGSVIGVADSNGNILARNTYDEYGIPKSDQGTLPVYGRFAYTGQIWLPELGMYHYKARLYSPTLGRFMQTDPIGYDDQINLYAYVGNDPMNASDPSGKTCEPDGEKQKCKIDDPGKMTADQQTKANKVYTDRVNKLNEDPNKKVTLSVKSPTGRIPITETTTQGAIAKGLASAFVVAASSQPKRNDGSIDTGTRATADVRQNVLTLYPRAFRLNMTELGRTFFHEGSHFTVDSWRLQDRYGKMGGKDFSDHHQSGYLEAAEEWKNNAKTRFPASAFDILVDFLRVEFVDSGGSSRVSEDLYRSWVIVSCRCTNRFFAKCVFL